MDVAIMSPLTDQRGHLSHVEAIRLFEVLRTQWYMACGLYPDPLPDDWPVSSVVVNVDYHFHAPCPSGETVMVVGHSGVRGNKSFTVEHKVVRADGTVAVDGRATSVIMSIADRAILPVPECLVRHMPTRI